MMAGNWISTDPTWLDLLWLAAIMFLALQMGYRFAAMVDALFRPEGWDLIRKTAS